MTQKTARSMLPFSVLSESRTDPFSDEVERATVYCFVELERGKGGGLILKKPPEKLVFLAEFGYPLWFVPWRELNLLFDGLKTTAHVLTYRTIPDAKAFTENVQRSSRALETYTTFLSDNVNYFKVSSNEKTISMDALITEPNFLNEFNAYFSEAKQVETSPPEIVFLPPAIDEPTLSSVTQELESLKLEFKEEASILYGSMKLLNRITRNFVKTIRSKMKAIREEFGEEIKKQEKIITPKVNRINEEYEEQITKITKDFENQLLPLQQEKVKLEKTKEETVSKIERCKIEAKTCAVNKDVVGERKWKEKASETKKELSRIEANIREVGAKIKGVEESRSLETFRLRSECEAKIKEARKDLLELESSRDAKIQIHKKEVDKLESLSSTIIQQIDSTAKMREGDLANFEKLGTQQKSKNYELVYLPFYLACYQAGLKRRYVLFSPSVANNVSFLTKLKGVLGQAKVKQLLVPRFKTITSFLNKLPSLMDQNAVFEREIKEAGDKADILRASSIREQIKNGLMRLKEEGWLSEKEYAVFAEPPSKTQT